MGIDTADELEEYMLELLDGTQPNTQKFIKELLVRWRPYRNFAVPNAQVCMILIIVRSFSTERAGNLWHLHNSKLPVMIHCLLLV